MDRQFRPFGQIQRVGDGGLVVLALRLEHGLGEHLGGLRPPTAHDRTNDTHTPLATVLRMGLFSFVLAIPSHASVQASALVVQPTPSPKDTQYPTS